MLNGFDNFDAFTNPPNRSIQTREQARQEIAAQVGIYLAKGGTIETVASGEMEIPPLTSKEQIILKTLYLRHTPKPASQFDAPLREHLLNLRCKKLIWTGDGLVKITARGHIVAAKLFPVECPEL